MPVNKDIIRQCKKGDEKAQEFIFNKYSPVLFGISLRYMKSRVKAEDVMQDAFITIFTKIKQYNGKGSFEGWIKRITINTALMQLRQDKKEIISNIIEDVRQPEVYEDNTILKNPKSIIENAKFTQSEIFDAITELPEGFRTVFNMYVVDELKHKEIAKELDISIGTSKSQLLRARKKLEGILYENALIKLKNTKKEIF
ncbi:MAG: RNA polymerase sigma factor [Bacteroidales bacterium]|nr:RNA polymerase sigma factor [Bacteroidales bacterium]